MINQILADLGFNQKEIEVYLEVLKRGKTLPSSVANATGINRATVYSVSRNLIDKGLITGDVGAKTLELTALPINELNNLIEKETNKLLQKKKIVNKAIEELSHLPFNTQYSVPSIRFIEEDDLEDFMYKRIDKWNDSVTQSDKTWWGFQDHTFVENFETWISGWFKRESSKNLNVKLLSNVSNIENKMKERKYQQREIRFWKREINFTSTLWIAGEYLIMIYTQDKPFYLIEINNYVLAQNMREVFKHLWSEVINGHELARAEAKRLDNENISNISDDEDIFDHD